MFRAFFYWVWGGSNHFFLVLPTPLAPAPALCRVRVRVFTPPSEAQDCCFFVFVQFRPADALLSSEPGGDQGTLFARNVVQGYVRVCVPSFIFCALYLFYFFSSTKHFPPPRGAVGVATFHPWYLSFPRLTPAMAMVRGRFWHNFSLVLAPVFPFRSTKVCLVMVLFLWFVCRRAFSAPPPPHNGGTRQVFDGWFALL